MRMTPEPENLPPEKILARIQRDRKKFLIAMEELDRCEKIKPEDDIERATEKFRQLEHAAHVSERVLRRIVRDAYWLIRAHLLNPIDQTNLEKKIKDLGLIIEGHIMLDDDEEDSRSM